MKILCVCEGGNSRSATLAFLFKDGLYQDALAMGLRTSSEETRQMLYKWAEVIILVAGEFKNEIPEEFKSKLKVWDVGHDVYWVGASRRLVNKYKEYMQKDGFDGLKFDEAFLSWMDSSANRD